MTGAGAVPVNDIDVSAGHRAPVLYRDETGRAVRAGLASQSVEVAIRRVPGDAMEPFPRTAPRCLTPYRVHDGRAWLPVTETSRTHDAWIDVGCRALVPVRDVVAALGGTPGRINYAVFGRGPFSARRPAGMNGPTSMDGLQRDDGLRPRASDAVEAQFARDVVHDGISVWIATPLPLVRIHPRPGVHCPWGEWMPPSALCPLRGPAVRADLVGDYVALAMRHGRFPRMAGIRVIAAEIVESAKSIGLAFDDADVTEAVNDAAAYAWERAMRALAQPARRMDPGARATLSGLADGALATALLGSVGAIRPDEALAALEQSLALFRQALACHAPGREARLDAWLIEYLETLARPRLLARTGLPGDDAEALATLAP